jgi:hypothetical protein
MRKHPTDFDHPSHSFHSRMQVYKIPSDSELYSIRRPILNRTFNDRDYPNLQILLDDLESIIEWSLKHELEIARRDLPVRLSSLLPRQYSILNRLQLMSLPLFSSPISTELLRHPDRPRSLF